MTTLRQSEPTYRPKDPPAISSAAGNDWTGHRVADRYEVFECQGIGGMAVIYRALDTVLDRLVALKVPRVDLAADDRLLLRAELKHQASARLGHVEHVVLVHDLGEHAGLPFGVLEFVDGTNLAQVMAERSVTVAEAIEIGLQVAKGLKGGHDAGVKHLDLKPSNVLLVNRHGPRWSEIADPEERHRNLMAAVRTLPMGEWLIKLGDFGLSQVGAANQSAWGSPPYMAPEQLQPKGEVTDRTDIYAFGLLLHDLLLGTPRGGRWPVRPPQPEHVQGPSSLRSLVTQCLSPRAADRPAAADLVVRLMAIQTEPERLIETRRQQRARVLKTSLVSVILVALIVASILLYQVNSWYQESRRHAQLASANLSIARETLDDLVERVGPLLVRRGNVQLLKEALEPVLPRYQRLLEQVPDDISTARREADAILTLAAVYWRLGLMTQSRAAAKSAETRYRDMLHRDNTPASCAGLARALTTQATVDGQADQLQEAESKLAEAIGLLEPWLRGEPTHPEVLFRLALAYNNRALCWQGKRPTDAAAEFARSIELLRVGVRGHQARREFREYLSKFLGNFALFAIAHPNVPLPVPAMALARESVAVAKAWAAREPNQVDALDAVATAHLNYGVVARHQKAWSDAESATREALATYQTLTKLALGVMDFEWGVGQAKSNLGELLTNFIPGKLAEASQLLEEAARDLDRLAKGYPYLSHLQRDAHFARVRKATADAKLRAKTP